MTCPPRVPWPPLPSLGAQEGTSAVVPRPCFLRNHEVDLAAGRRRELVSGFSNLERDGQRHGDRETERCMLRDRVTQTQTGRERHGETDAETQRRDTQRYR